MNYLWKRSVPQPPPPTSDGTAAPPPPPPPSTATSMPPPPMPTAGVQPATDAEMSEGSVSAAPTPELAALMATPELAASASTTPEPNVDAAGGVVTTSSIKSNNIPPAPGAPLAVERTATSLTVAWAEKASDPPPDYDFVLEPECPSVEFEVRYARANYKYDMWNSVGCVTTRRWIRVQGLLPNQAYIFQVRARFRDPNAPHVPSLEFVDLATSKSAKLPGNPNKWSPSSASSKPFATLLLDEQERFDNLGRLRLFILDGANGLPQYPEDPEVPDTYGAKAARTMEGLVTAVSSTGLGGTYFALVQSAWKIHKTGLASLIFHPDLQQTVYVLLNFLNTVAANIGLSSKDVVVGSYFALWEAKKERLLYPMAEFEEHSQGKPGVLESAAPQVLINELMFYFPLAGMAYRKTPAEIQWVLEKFTAADPKYTNETFGRQHPETEEKGSAQRGFRLIAARTRSAKFQPAFFLAAHEELKTAVFVIRGTHELDDLVTDGLCDVQAAPFHFGEDAREFHVHAGMLEAAKWLVRGDDRRRHFEEDTKVEPADAKDAEDNRRDGAGVGAAVAKLWAAGYRRVVITGHSLGAGVAVLAALLIAERFRDLTIKVYGYGTPAVVDETLAEACKGEHAKDISINGLGTRVTVKNVVRHDDLVPRLSILTAKDFAVHLQNTRSKWSPLLNEDIASFTQRIKTVWAPVQRAHAKKRTVGRLKDSRRSSNENLDSKPPSSDSAPQVNVEDVSGAVKVDESVQTDAVTVGDVAGAVASEALLSDAASSDVQMTDASLASVGDVKMDEASSIAKEGTSSLDDVKMKVEGDAVVREGIKEEAPLAKDAKMDVATEEALEDATVEEAFDQASKDAQGKETEAKKSEPKVEEVISSKKRKQQEIEARLERSFSNRLVVPGLIVHTYKHHGTHLASLVDFRFHPLRRINAFQNCIDDHRFEEIMIAVRSVLFANAAREAGRLPPHWESLSDHMNDEEEWQVRCRVCTYPVSWHHTSSSEAFEIRATHHCHSCGKIVCDKCSEGRVALPHIGIINSVRVCDLCKYHLFEPKTGQKNMFDFEEY